MMNRWGNDACICTVASLGCQKGRIRNMRKWLMGVYLCICMAAVGLSGCTPQNAATMANRSQHAGVYAEITDDMGRTVTLKEKPQRVVVLSTSILNFVSAVDGDVVGRATVKAEDASLADKYQQVPEVGPVYNVSTEKILELKPDLVIASVKQHQKLIPVLEQNHIPVIALDGKSYEDVTHDLELIGTIYGKEEAVTDKIHEMNGAIAAITDKLPKETKKVAIVYATPSAVSVQLPNSIAGNVAQILHFENTAASAQQEAKGTEKVPYSMEALAEQNPDIIFFTSMGPKDKIEKRIQEDVKSNPAWSTLRAVQEGHVYVLPEHYFLLNPGLAYPKAIAYMAKLVYPEVYP